MFVLTLIEETCPLTVTIHVTLHVSYLFGLSTLAMA
jgi:hypothetical protein